MTQQQDSLDGGEKLALFTAVAVMVWFFAQIFLAQEEAKAEYYRMYPPFFANTPARDDEVP